MQLRTRLAALLQLPLKLTQKSQLRPSLPIPQELRLRPTAPSGPWANEVEGVPLIWSGRRLVVGAVPDEGAVVWFWP